MDTRSTLLRIAAAALSATLALPASAGGVYRTIDADGTVVFTDVPPPLESRAEEPRETSDHDAAVERANARVDFAEHALAIARQGPWSYSNAMRLDAPRPSGGDKERAAFYMKDVLRARDQLIELKHGRAAPPSTNDLVASR